VAFSRNIKIPLRTSWSWDEREGGCDGVDEGRVGTAGAISMGGGGGGMFTMGVVAGRCVLWRGGGAGGGHALGSCDTVGEG